MILAIHHLVEQMPNATMVHAHVYLNIKVILILAVDPSVFSVPTVQEIEHASGTNVSIHVQELVDKMPSVMLTIIFQCVHAQPE